MAQAIKAYQNAVRINPNMHESWYGIGLIMENQNFIIIEDFYNNPDEVREYALSLPYRNDVHGEHFWRTTPKLNLSVIPHLESYIGRKIAMDHYWEEHSDEDYIEMNICIYILCKMNINYIIIH